MHFSWDVIAKLRIAETALNQSCVSRKRLSLRAEIACVLTCKRGGGKGEREKNGLARWVSKASFASLLPN